MKRIASLWRNLGDTARARIFDIAFDSGGPAGVDFNVDIFYRDPGVEWRTASADVTGFFSSRAEALDWIREELGPVKAMRLPADADTFTYGW